jgi:hypothetical protein
MNDRYLLKTITFFAVFAALTTTAHAQSTVSTSNLSIPVIERPPELADFAGMEPSAEIRGMMSFVTGFVQRVPDDGAPASQRTEVYVAYDDRNLYAIFLAFDDEPELVRANLSPRENVEDDDTVGLLIDTFNDQRTGYAFRSTPLGVQWDGRWSEVTRNPGFDSSYEAVWNAEGQRTDQGYIVSMTVPLKTLRFPEMGEQVWRIMFERQTPRLSEEAHWPAYSNTITGRLNQAATMTGIRDVSPGRNILLIPFGFVRDYDVLDRRAVGGPTFNNDTEDEFGVDAKFVFNDSLVLDATYNPDFSQIESDEPQVTVNERFEVRFPERRPFFLENADFFQTETTLVFTRRIVEPQAGLRFTGKVGDWGIGTMIMDDEAPGNARPVDDPLLGEAADISVLRVFREISDQSRLGILATERTFGDSFNKISSFDGHLKLSENWTTEFQLIESDTRRLSGEMLSGTQRNIRIDRRGRYFSAHVHATDTTEEFRADLGFLWRTYSPDTDGIHSTMSYTFWPEDSAVNSWGPGLRLVHLDDQEGTRIFSQITPSMVWAWDGDTELNVNLTSIRERLRPQDLPGLAATRDYDPETVGVAFETQAFSTVGFSVNLETGTAINIVPEFGVQPELADSRSVEFELLWRPIDRLRADTTYLSTQLDDRGGAGKIFSNEIFRTRWNYQFTKELSLRFIAQYEETDAGVFTSLEDEKSMNYDALVRYVINPWSALYVGFNSNSSNFELIDTEEGTELIRTGGLRRDGEQFFVKFSYLLQP